MTKEGFQNSSVNRYLILAIVLLATLSLALMIALVVLTSNRFQENPNQSGQKCNQGLIKEKQIFLNEEPRNPPIFHDLTKSEVKGIQKYLYEQSDLNLVQPSANKTNSSYVFTMELYLPNKTDVLKYVDENGPKPPRMAKVIIFRDISQNPEINEIIVEPLPNPSSHRPVPGRPQSIRYLFRPITDEEYYVAIDYLNDIVESNAGELLMAAFGARLMNCGDKCLGFRYLSSFSPDSSGQEKRQVWYWLHYLVEYYLLYPVDFSLLLSGDANSFSIESVWYSGRTYDSLDALMDQYRQNKLSLNISYFPVDKSFSMLYRRGRAPNLSERRDPVQFYPDGQRYAVKNRHIEYMDWSFDFRLSTTYGPQIYDIKFRKDRIAYEIGLQEISVYYSGNSPHQKFSDFIDSVEVFGRTSKGLIPGVDCPEMSTFMSAFYIQASSLEPTEMINAFCVFEWNTGEPLRRHYSKSYADVFFEGLQTTVLILRTIMTISNYDYIIDFRFYPNGVIETKAFSTGYILANAYAEEEKRYAFQLHDQMVGSYHLHLFHFKADLDIGGTSNRYETLDISAHTEPNPLSSKQNATFTQGQIIHRLKTTELDAAYHYNFDQPKYHLFYKQNNTDRFGNNKAYRLIANGFTKQILPPGIGKEPSVSWSRYQTAVTQRKETERQSSTLYANFDTLDPVVNFTSFINENESIVDEDLVTWITLGVHHIPHTEDLPIVTTPGMGLSFMLQPFNFFTEDPAMTSPNAVRLELNKKNILSSGVKVERYGKSSNIDTCHVSSNDFFDMLKDDYRVVFTD